MVLNHSIAARGPQISYFLTHLVIRTTASLKFLIDHLNNVTMKIAKTRMYHVMSWSINCRYI